MRKRTPVEIWENVSRNAGLGCAGLLFGGWLISPDGSLNSNTGTLGFVISCIAIGAIFLQGVYLYIEEKNDK